MADRESYLYQAKLAEQAERYDEMVEAMKSIARLNTNLSIEERNLLSVGYKNLIGTRRASWRVVTAIESKEKEQGEPSSVKIQVIDKYRAKIEKELTDICDDVLSLLKDTLIPLVNDDKDIEAKVFYHKMKGDYYRYMSEILPDGDRRKESALNSLSAYKEAVEIAKAEGGLSPVHPIRLGLALNFSVFYYEILNSPKEAKTLAQQAFEEAVKELSGMDDNESSYKDSTLILQLLRDNLTLWNSDEQDETERQRQVDDLEEQ